MGAKITAAIKSSLNSKTFNPPEDEINLESFKQFSLLTFRLLLFNFNPLGDGADLKEKFVHFAGIIYFWFRLVSFLVAAFCMFADGFDNFDEFETASKSITNAFFVLLIALKTFATFVRLGDIFKIFREIEMMEERRKGLNKKYGVKKFLDEYNFYMKIYSIPIVTILIPTSFAVFRYVFYGIMELPLRYWFPFNIYKNEVFPFALFFVEFVAFNICPMMLAIDSMVYALITVIAMEFHILKTDFANIKYIPKDRRAKYIQELIDRHNKLFDLSNHLQDIYSMSFLVTYSVSSVILCSGLFQIAVVRNDLTTVAFYVPYIGLIGGQTLMLCIYGQKLIDASESVVEGIYNCEWEDSLDEKFTKQLVLMIQRAQNAKCLTAMNFANVSHETFTTVCSYKHAFGNDLITTVN